MSKTIMSIDLKDKEMITLSIDRDRFVKGVTDPESFKKLMNEIRDMIFISLHYNDDIPGLKSLISTLYEGRSNNER